MSDHFLTLHRALFCPKKPYIMSKNEVYRRAKFAKEKLLEIIQVNVLYFFLFDEISKIRMLGPKNLFLSHFDKEGPKKVKIYVSWRWCPYF